MNYELTVTMKCGATYKHKVCPEFCTHNLCYYADGLKFTCKEDYVNYEIFKLHEKNYEDIIYVELSHFGTTIYEKGKEPDTAESITFTVSAKDTQKGKHDNFKVYETFTARPSDFVRVLNSFRSTFETLGYNVEQIDDPRCLIAVKKYNKRHKRSFMLRF